MFRPGFAKSTWIRWSPRTLQPTRLNPPLRPCQKSGDGRLICKDAGILHCPSSLLVQLEGKPVEKRGDGVLLRLYTGDTGALHSQASNGFRELISAYYRNDQDNTVLLPAFALGSAGVFPYATLALDPS